MSTDAAFLFSNAGLQNCILGLPVHQKTILIFKPMKSLNIFGTLQIKVSHHVDIVVAPAANCIDGRGL
jgi:hypothetical protein